MRAALANAIQTSDVLLRRGNHMIVPSCSARLLNFF